MPSRYSKCFMAAMRASTLLLLAALALIVDGVRAPGEVVHGPNGTYEVVDGGYGSWMVTQATPEEIAEMYDQSNGAYQVWDLTCARLVVWSRKPHLQTMFLDCDLCRPLETVCVYSRWDAVLNAIGYPLQTLAQIADNWRCPLSGTEGFSNFCAWYCVPDVARDTCEKQGLPRHLLEEVLWAFGVGAHPPGLPDGLPLPWPEFHTKLGSAAQPAGIAPGTIVKAHIEPEGALWVAQRELPEGWVVRRAGTDVELVLLESQLEIAPLDNEEVIALHEKHIESLRRCRSACSEHEGDGKESMHDKCCWTYAGMLEQEHGSFVSASCVAICTGRKKPFEKLPVEQQLASWVTISQ